MVRQNYRQIFHLRKSLRTGFHETATATGASIAFSYNRGSCTMKDYVRKDSLYICTAWRNYRIRHNRTPTPGKLSRTSSVINDLAKQSLSIKANWGRKKPLAIENASRIRNHGNTGKIRCTYVRLKPRHKWAIMSYVYS